MRKLLALTLKCLLGAVALLLAVPLSASATPPSPISGLRWEGREIWVSDGLRSRDWPLAQAVAIWDSNGVVKVHYSTRSCSELPSPCVPVGKAPTPAPYSAYAYTTMQSQGSSFIAVSVSIIEGRGRDLNLCTLVHELGHVVADIPDGWKNREGRRAVSFMNAACDGQLEKGLPVVLPQEDRAYVEAVYDSPERLESVEKLRVSPLSVAFQSKDEQREKLLLLLLVSASVTLGASGTLLAQRLRP